MPMQCAAIFKSMKINNFQIHNTVMIRSFRTDRSGQTVQTQIRQLPVLLYKSAVCWDLNYMAMLAR